MRRKLKLNVLFSRSTLAVLGFLGLFVAMAVVLVVFGRLSSDSVSTTATSVQYKGIEDSVVFGTPKPTLPQDAIVFEHRDDPVLTEINKDPITFTVIPKKQEKTQNVRNYDFTILGAIIIAIGVISVVVYFQQRGNKQGSRYVIEKAGK